MTIAVSVIIPCYNVEGYIDACLQSLAGQSLRDLEIICVDDGSTDGTLECLRAWERRDARVRVISQSNAGSAAARNTGLDAACGTYVGFVDSDDLAVPEMYERLYGGAVAHDADVAVCGFETFSDETGEVLERESWSPVAAFHPDETADRFRRGSAWCHCVGAVWNKLYRRSMIEEHALRFVVGIRAEEDLAYVLALLPFAPRLLTMPDRLYRYRRMRKDSLTYDSRHYLNDYRMNLLDMRSVTLLWQQHGLWEPQTAFGLIDFYMEFLRRHFILKEGNFAGLGDDDRRALLAGWREWLALAGNASCFARLNHWDQAFCRLLREYPLRGNAFTRLRDSLLSRRKGRRGAYHALRREMMRLSETERG